MSKNIINSASVEQIRAILRGANLSEKFADEIAKLEPGLARQSANSYKPNELTYEAILQIIGGGSLDVMNTTADSTLQNIASYINTVVQAASRA